MRLGRLGDRGHERPVLLEADMAYDLTGILPDLGGEHLAPATLSRIREAHSAGELPPLASAGLRIGAPISQPGTVYCIGQNYAAHAAESGSAVPQRPIVFLKPPNTIVGPNDGVDIPRRSERTDWEVELAVVIGTRATYLDDHAEAATVIAGYVTANDLSERAFQLAESGGQWSKGKAAAGFLPLGPWLVTSDDVEPQTLGLRSWVNGSPRQDSTTADMIFPVLELIRDLSWYTVLEPGDVVLTGTPQGVALSGRFPYLRKGDVVEVEIDGLGRQRTTFGQA